MSRNSGEKCPYCSVINETEVVTGSHGGRGSFFGFIGYDRIKQRKVRSLRIDCVFCTRRYTLLKFEDLDWVRDRLIWDDSVRTGMLKLLGTSLSRDNILSDITGIALREDGSIDICFKKGGKRAYMSCIKETTTYKGVYMREIDFG